MGVNIPYLDGMELIFCLVRPVLILKAVPFVFVVHVVFLVTGACLLKKGGRGALCFLWKGRSNKGNGGFVFYKCVPSTEGIMVQNGASKRWTPEIPPLL